MGNAGVVKVHLESPWRDGEYSSYALACLRDSLSRGEAPFASHLLYTQVLDDADTEERAHGMAMGDAWREIADKVVFYVDHGWTEGMIDGFNKAYEQGKVFEVRRLL